MRSRGTYPEETSQLQSHLRDALFVEICNALVSWFQDQGETYIKYTYIYIYIYVFIFYLFILYLFTCVYLYIYT